MSGWGAAELAALETEELRIASYRPDGTLRPSVPIWFARLADEVFVRSAYGPDNGWFRRAAASGSGRITANGLERDVAFERPGPEVDRPLTAAYHAKYDRYGAKIVGTVVSDDAVRCTLRLVPR